MMNDAKEIYEAVLGELRKDLAGQVRQYENRIATLEKQIINLQMQLSGLQMKVENQSLIKEVPRYNEVPVKENAYSAKKIDMNRIDVSCGFKYNGWVYYENEEMGNFLYKVRTDGTDNQQLTNYSVSLYLCSVSGGKLHFFDNDYIKREINL